MIALSDATGWVMVAGWMIVLLGVSIMREDGAGALRARPFAPPLVAVGLAVALVARVAV